VTRLFPLALVALLGAAANGAAKAAPGPLIIEAEVVTPGPAVPPPGTVHGLQVDRYRVRRVVSGSYGPRVLFAAREAGTPFAVGTRLMLTLSPKLPESASPLVTDSAEVGRVGLFYCTKFETL
jgi:hypothetical protein